MLFWFQVEFLDTFFADGSAYVLGPEDKDCWYLYTLLPVEGNSLLQFICLTKTVLNDSRHVKSMMCLKIITVIFARLKVCLFWTVTNFIAPRQHYCMLCVLSLIIYAQVISPPLLSWAFVLIVILILGTVGALEKEEQHDRTRRDLGGYTPEPDQTMEMLMSDLDPEIMAIFTKEHCKDAEEATKVCIHRSSVLLLFVF